MRYRPDIDGLRAVAVLIVVAFHVGLPGFEGGFVGVDIFFVISGFLITTLLAKEYDKTGGIKLLHFYARRIRRLLPAILCVLVSILCLGVFLLHPFGEQQELAKATLASLFFVSNIYFARTTGGYFDTPDSEVPLLHFWTLSVEEQFYILWPLTLLLLGALASRTRMNLARVQVVGVLSLAIASLAYSLYLTGLSIESAYFLMPSRAWQLLAGAILGLLLLNQSIKRFVSDFWMHAAYLAGVTLLLAGLWSIEDPDQYPGWPALLPTLSAVCIIFAGSLGHSGHILNKLLSLAPVVYVGKLSFSWYLWHWPLIAMAQSYFLGTDSIPRNLGLAVVSLVLSVLTYHYIEQRFRHVGLTQPGNIRKVMLSGGVATVFAAFLAGTVGWTARHAVDYQPWWDVDQSILVARYSRPESRYACHYDAPFDGLLKRKECIIGASGAQVRAVLWGDSHAGHLAPLLDRLGQEQGLGFLRRSFSACRPLLGTYSYLDDFAARHCQHFQRAVLRELSALRSAGLKGVILGGHWTDGFTSVIDDADGVQHFKRALADTLDALESLGLKVLLVEPTPTLSFNAIGCLARRIASDCVTKRADWEKKRLLVTSVFRAASKDRDLVKTLDLTSYFCDLEYCYASRNGLILFRDDNHITPSAALELLELAQKELLWVIGSRLPVASDHEHDQSIYPDVYGF